MLRKRPLYSACNEDTRSELAALDVGERDTVIAVAAGGGRALGLLTARPRRLLVVDRRLDQLFQLELKAAAMEALPWESFRGFVGLVPDGGRLDLYHALRPALSRSARRYWDRRRSLVAAGVLYAGRFEQAFGRIARAVARAGLFDWGQRYFAFESLEAQREALAQDELRARRDGMLWWRVFTHPAVVYASIQDPGFLRHTHPSLWQYVFERLVAYLHGHLARESFLLRLIGQGRYAPDGPLPLWLERSGFEAARKQVERLELVHATLEDLPGRLRPDGPLKWSLSDVSAWMSEGDFHELLRVVTSLGEPGSRFCARNFAARRSIPPDLRPRVRRLDALCERLDRDDASVFFRFEVGRTTPLPPTPTG